MTLLVLLITAVCAFVLTVALTHRKP